MTFRVPLEVLAGARLHQTFLGVRMGYFSLRTEIDKAVGDVVRIRQTRHAQHLVCLMPHTIALMSSRAADSLEMSLASRTDARTSAARAL